MHMETVLKSNDIETVARVGDTLGYARVSTHDQNPDAQRDRLIEAGAIRVFTDIVSGKRFDRPALAKLIEAGLSPARTAKQLGMAGQQLTALQRRCVEVETVVLRSLRVILRTNLAMTPGMSTRDIQAHVGELYGVTISPELVSVVTDSVIAEVRAWQSRPLESTYAIVYFDALRVKIRDEGLVRNKAVYLAIGVRCSGHKEILGLWIEQTEGAKFWLRVMNDLKARGVQDILIAIVDGLKGFPEAITAVFPDTIVQPCIVHLIRNSARLASWKERKPLDEALKPAYQADNTEAADQALGAFESGVIALTH